MWTETVLVYFFLLSVLKIRLLEKNLGTGGLLGRQFQEAQKGNGQSETKKGEKRITSMLMSKLPCGQLGLSSAGKSLRSHVGHVSESSHWKTESL